MARGLPDYPLWIAAFIDSAALVTAVWDLRARLAGKPMWRFLAEMPASDLVAAVDFRHAMLGHRAHQRTRV